MIAHWENECIYLPVNSQPWQSISIDLFLTDRTLPTRPEPARQKMARKHHTTFGQRGGKPKSNHEQTMADKKSNTSDVIY